MFIRSITKIVTVQKLPNGHILQGFDGTINPVKQATKILKKKEDMQESVNSRFPVRLSWKL